MALSESVVVSASPPILGFDRWPLTHSFDPRTQSKGLAGALPPVLSSASCRVWSGLSPPVNPLLSTNEAGTLRQDAGPEIVDEQ